MVLKKKAVIQNTLNRKSIFTIFLALYTFLITIYTCYISIAFLYLYLKEYNFGLILTDIGSGIILPLLPVSRLILAILGIIGIWKLYFSKSITGLKLIGLWGILQIPTITLSFSPVTKALIYGAGALNVQVFWVGWNWLTHMEHYSVFSKTKWTLTTGIGINFVGLIVLIIALLIGIQSNQKAREKLLGAKKIAFNLITSALFIGLLTIAATYYITIYSSKPDLSIEISNVKFLNYIKFDIGQEEIYSIVTEVNLKMSNKGNKAATIETVKLGVRPISSEWGKELGVIMPHFPKGIEDYFKGFYSSEILWNALKENKLDYPLFKPVRVQENDTINTSLYFIVLLDTIGRGWIKDDNILMLEFDGKAFVKTVDENEFVSPSKFFIGRFPISNLINIRVKQ